MSAPRNLAVLAALAVVVGLPFALRPKADQLAKADETLVIITPHNEAIRYEFARAFAAHHLRETGRTVRIDWRTPGGTSEIARYLASEYAAAFRLHWERNLKRSWTGAVEAAFHNPRVIPGDSPADDTPEMAARRSFLASNVGCGIDLFFGGGSYDFAMQADAGRLVSSGFVESRPDLFGPEAIPQSLGGEPYYDTTGRWLGTCLSAFGICYNEDALGRLRIDPPPSGWSDLGSPAYQGQLAVADPTKSGSIAKAFELLIQQQMQEAWREFGDLPSEERERRAVREGWNRGIRLIQRIAANARYFTDAASKIPLDVALGDAAAGMCIDFYGRTQSEAVRRADGSSRMRYFTPVGGSSVGVDPIALLRGAPSPETARAFIDFVMSEEGQRLWNYRPGTPGGPEKFALRRLPILRSLYEPGHLAHSSDPEVRPYEEAARFNYHPAWTAPLFRTISFIVRVMCLDPHDELRASWAALVEAGLPPEALERFASLEGVEYDAASTTIRDALRSGDKLAEVRLARELGEGFRARYREAAAMARAGTVVSRPTPGETAP
jgi:iron(III) transport system substrate-binding protein